MSYTPINLHDPPVSATSPTDTTKPPSQLRLYQTLVGDIDAPLSKRSAGRSLYQQTVAQERRAKHWFWISGLIFAVLVTAQIVFCLSISIGAQMGVTNNMISILAGVNTLVAAGIAALKALSLPDRKAAERLRLRQILERVEYTTRRLRAGLKVDVEKEAEDIRTEFETAGDEEAGLFAHLASSVSMGPASGGAPQTK